MEQDMAEKTAVFLIKNGVKASDIYFDWKKIFNEMVDIELGGKNGGDTYGSRKD